MTDFKHGVWYPIETAPKRKFISVIGPEEFQTTAIDWTNEDNIWRFDTWITNVNNEPLSFTPTHWMPLSKKPEDL